MAVKRRIHTYKRHRQESYYIIKRMMCLDNFVQCENRHHVLSSFTVKVFTLIGRCVTL